MTDRERAFALAEVHLAAARDILKVVRAKGPLAKVRAAITSTINHREK